jgi:serine/threonine protein kinase
VIGVADLHALGYAHTDIKVDNIFVDNGTAFLSDLEFVVATSAPARLEGRGLVGAAVRTAQEQDLVQLGLLSGDVLRL